MDSEVKKGNEALTQFENELSSAARRSSKRGNLERAQRVK